MPFFFSWNLSNNGTAQLRNTYLLLTEFEGRTYILLTKREGRTGRISARGLDSTKKTEGRYSPSTVPSKFG